LHEAGITPAFTNGVLTLTFANYLGNTDFNLSLIVTDSAGNAMQSTYDFKIFNTEEGTGSSSQNGLYVYESSTSITTLMGSDNHVFLNYGADLYIVGSGNSVYASGISDNEFIFTATASGNTIYGSAGSDQVTFHNGNNSFYGFGGNDEITLNLSSGTTNNILLASGGGTVIDGGSGRDVLKLSGGAGDLNFTAIAEAGNSIRNIEMIDLTDGSQQNITLSYQDVINLTDSNRTLFIDLGSEDDLNLSDGAFAGFDFSMSNYFDTENIGGVLYYGFQIGDVTLYLDTDALNAVS
jgi:hypothetical protein